MKAREITTLSIVGNKEEAKMVLGLVKDSHTIISTNLATELYLKKYIKNYKNPLYDLILNSKYLRLKEYIFSNFDIVYDFCNDKYLQYFRDRLGYFLAELERSLDLADEAIKKIKPNNIIIGEIRNFSGSSVVDGTLKTNAFFLTAQDKKIPYKLIGDEKKSFSLRQSIGKKIQSLRYLKKQNIPNESDLLILATPSHLIQMTPIINKIQNMGTKISILTYDVTISSKKLLDKNFPIYLEKEKLIDSRIKDHANRLKSRLLRKKCWQNFKNDKYSKNLYVLEHIKWKIKDILENELYSIFNDLFLAEKVFSKLKPKALLVTTDPDSKVLPYINKAKDMGIKTICIQHGAFYGKDSPAIYPVSHYFIAWSKISKNWLEKTDYFKKVKIIVGRSPFHNYVDHMKKRGKSKRLVILYLGTKQPTADKGLVCFYLKKFFDSLSKIDKDFLLLVRVHPFQNISNLESLMENFNHETHFINNLSLEKTISKSDIVVYENTTAGFDAMLFGKPTIYFNPYTGEDFFNVGIYKASFLILNDKDLELGLPFLINNKNIWKELSDNGRKFAIKYLGLNNSKLKLANIINNLIDK